MKLLIFAAMLAVAIYYTLGNRNEVETKVADVRDTGLEKQVNSVEIKAPAKIKSSEQKSQEASRVEVTQPIKQASLTPKKLLRRPTFYVKHRGLKAQSCNLAYKEADETVIPADMQIHDYFKWNDEYYFAVSTEARKFLLKAKDIAKEECSKSDLALAFKFAKYCKAKDLPKSKPVTASVTKEKEDSALTQKEISHIKSSIVAVNLKGDYFRQQGNTLKIYEEYKHDRRKEILEKVIGTYYLMDGHIPERYLYSKHYRTTTSATVWRTRGHDGKAAYCTSEEMAYYHAVCSYFESVKKQFYKGPKPTASRTRNYR